MARPRKFTDAELFADRVNKYFAEKKPAYTITGLCIHLDICRDTLCEMEKDTMFSDTIKKAKQKIENWVEEQSILGTLNPTVSIFNLKNNFGWKDKQEIVSDNTNKNTNLNADASLEELRALLKAHKED